MIVCSHLGEAMPKRTQKDVQYNSQIERTIFMIIPKVILTPRQIIIESILTSCGIAFGFTLERFWSSSSHARRRLKVMTKQRFLEKHKRANMNMYTLSPRFAYGKAGFGHLARKKILAKKNETEDEYGFNHCLVTHFLVLVREVEPSYITISGDDWIWTHNGEHRLVHVGNSRMIAATAQYPSLVIGNEIFTTDKPILQIKRSDILNHELIFYDNKGDIVYPLGRNGQSQGATAIAI